MPLHEDFHFRVTNGQRAEVKRPAPRRNVPAFRVRFATKKLSDLQAYHPNNYKFSTLISRSHICSSSAETEPALHTVLPKILHVLHIPDFLQPPSEIVRSVQACAFSDIPVFLHFFKIQKFQNHRHIILQCLGFTNRSNFFYLFKTIFLSPLICLFPD